MSSVLVHCRCLDDESMINDLIIVYSTGFS